MKINHGQKGFALEMFNGLRLSVQYGKSNYCERRDCSGGWEEPDASEIQSKDFEWAVWGEHELLSMGGDQVEGHVPFEMLPLVIDRVQRLKPGSRYVEPIGWQVSDAVMELQPHLRAEMVRVLVSK